MPTQPWAGPFPGPLPRRSRRVIGQQLAENKFEPTTDGFNSEYLKVSGSGTIQHPFQLQAGTSGLSINVRYGTLNDIVPVNVGDDITLGASGTYTFYLDVEVEQDAEATIISVTLSNATTGQPADDDDHAYITLGEAIVSGGEVTTINQAATHSLRFAPCNRVAADPEADPPISFERGTYEFWGF